MKMYESLNSPATVYFEMNHEDCWTNITEDMDISIHTLMHNVYPERHYILASIETKSPKTETFKEFIKKLKKSSSVLNIENIEIIDKQKKLFKVIFKEKYERMISSSLFEHKAMDQKDSIQHNLESVSAIVPEDEINGLKSELDELGSLKNFRSIELKKNGNINELFDLTDQEACAIYTALKNGYYNVPREIYLKDLARITGLSKSSLAEYLRKGMNKIVFNWGERNMFFIEKKIKKR